MLYHYISYKKCKDGEVLQSMKGIKKSVIPRTLHHEGLRPLSLLYVTSNYLSSCKPLHSLYEQRLVSIMDVSEEQ